MNHVHLKAFLLPLTYEPKYSEKLEKIERTLQTLKKYKISKWSVPDAMSIDGYKNIVESLATEDRFDLFVFSILKKTQQALHFQMYLKMIRWLLDQPYLKIVFIVFDDEEGGGSPSEKHCKTFEKEIGIEKKKKYVSGRDFLWLCTNVQGFSEKLVGEKMKQFLINDTDQASKEHDPLSGHGLQPQNKGPTAGDNQTYEYKRCHDHQIPENTDIGCTAPSSPSFGLLRVLIANFDSTVELTVVERFLDTASKKNRQYEFKHCRYEASIMQVNEVAKELQKEYDFAIFALHAHESRLSINEPTAGIGYYTFYKTLREITGDRVVIVLGGDTSTNNEALSEWALRKISTQFPQKYIDGDKGLVISWNDKPNACHYQTLFKFLRVDDSLINKHFTEVRTSERYKHQGTKNYQHQDHSNELVLRPPSVANDTWSGHGSSLSSTGATQSHRQRPPTATNSYHNRHHSFSEQTCKRPNSSSSLQLSRSYNDQDLKWQKLLISYEEQLLKKDPNWRVLGAIYVVNNELTDYQTIKGSGTEKDTFVPNEWTCKLAQKYINMRNQKKTYHCDPNKFWLIILERGNEEANSFAILEETL